MSQRITIDPVTRIEGHLRIDCEIENGVVSRAWASGTMWRGMEEIVKGRDPRDAWMIVQRICGVCTTTHAISSACGGKRVENQCAAERSVHSKYYSGGAYHPRPYRALLPAFCTRLGRYHLSVAGRSAKSSALLKGISTWSLNSAEEFAKVQQKIKTLVASGQLGIFANGYWGHPAMKLPPEINLIAVAHYLQALECQRDANRVVALLGGKSPHIQNLAAAWLTRLISMAWACSILSV
jgi:hydrogenase large subunit